MFTSERTPIFIGYKWTNRSVGNRVFYQIKRNRERKIRVVTRKKKETFIFFSTPEIIFLSFLFLSFSIVMQGYVIFIGWKDTEAFRFQKLWDLFIFSFEFIWWVWIFSMFIFFEYIVWLLERTLSYYSN